IESHVDRFIAGVKAAGYARGSVSTKRAALRRFLLWRRRRKLAGSEPDESEVAQFMARSSRLAPQHRCLASTALTAFLGYLRREGVIATSTAAASETISSALEKRYADFLRNDKGLAELSLRVYLPLVADLLGYLKKQHCSMSVSRLDAGMLRAFLFDRAQGRSSEFVRLLATSLRSFLRFLHAQGEISHDLTAAVPTVRRWTHPDIPRKLTPEEVDRVLCAPDRTTAKGRRDLAILLLLAKLGLRSSEVLALELGDIRWRTGEILIRGKGGRRDVLPLPREAGAALAGYLRLDRDVRPTQRVFLRANAPRVPLSGPASIGHIVRHAMEQAAVERPKQIAAHLFRHTLASSMLQQGASLRDISEILRHRAPGTTEIYAKIDMRSLNEVVRPWPKKGGMQ
ncbi:MAG: tyrosine-type recombinase/integrase, partial [Planctomycetota bacterium]